MSDAFRLFMDDALEHLDACDRAAMALDAALDAGAPLPAGALDALFRAVHTLKGNGGMLGLGDLVGLAHALEELLDALRQGGLAGGREVADVVFLGLDGLRAVIADLATGAAPTFDARAVAARLRDPLAGLGPASADVAARLPGWQAAPGAEVALGVVAAGGPERLWRLAFGPGAPPAEDPLGHPDLEQLLALGKAIAWCRAEGDGLWLAYASRADEAIVRRFAPPTLAALGPMPDGPVPAPGYPPAAAVEAGREELSSLEGPDGTIRVGLGLLDALMTLVGELVLTRNQILQLTARGADAAMQSPVQRLNLITTELQEAVMRTRMQPIGQIWEKFPRLVRDYARQSGKSLRLELEGAETELDKSLLESIKDPLTHLVRNAMDHGIEAPERRTAAGKPAAGTIRLRARQDGGAILIEVADDGRGLDFERIRARAAAAGLAPAEALARMTEAELTPFLFQPGFSTADAVTDISGRGVGMDVVRHQVERAGGTVELASVPGKGTTTRLKIPLTLAVIPALVVKVGCERFALPQAGVLEVVSTGDGLSRVEQVRTSQVYRLRDALVPVVDAGTVLGLVPGAETAEARHLVVLQSGPLVFGLAVDEIGDTEEIVVKPLPRFLQAMTAYSGVTIMGDGLPSIILDPAGLAAMAGLDAAGAAATAADDDAAGDAGERRRWLVVGVADHRYAVPMDLVTRLEEFPAARLERVGARTVVQYGDRVLTLIDPAGTLGLAALAAGERAATVVIGVGADQVGVRVDAILDIVEDLAVPQPVAGVPGVAGVVVLGGRTTELLDVPAVIGAIAGGAR